MGLDLGLSRFLTVVLGDEKLLVCLGKVRLDPIDPEPMGVSCGLGKLFVRLFLLLLYSQFYVHYAILLITLQQVLQNQKTL